MAQPTTTITLKKSSIEAIRGSLNGTEAVTDTGQKQKSKNYNRLRSLNQAFDDALDTAEAGGGDDPNLDLVLQLNDYEYLLGKFDQPIWGGDDATDKAIVALLGLTNGDFTE